MFQALKKYAKLGCFLLCFCNKMAKDLVIAVYLLTYYLERIVQKKKPNKTVFTGKIAKILCKIVLNKKCFDLCNF